MNDDLLCWTDDTDLPGTPSPVGLPPWTLLVVDDDPEVHSVTRLVLNDLQILGRPLHLLHAHSGAEARALLAGHPEVAVALLDVVMETAQAGLELVSHIRQELGLVECRLILRTGEPGYAPELAVIQDYDINDYRTKGELTHTRLITAVSTALRSYQQLHAIAEQRRGLEVIVRAAAEMIDAHAIADLAGRVLNELAALLKLPVDGLVCVRSESPLGNIAKGWQVVGGAGRHAECAVQALASLPDTRIASAVAGSARRRQHVVGRNSAVLYLHPSPHQEVAIFLEAGAALATVDRALLDVFIASIAACFRGVELVEHLLQAQTEIEEQRSFLRTVIDANPHFIFVTDRQGQIRLANQSLAASFDLTVEQMLGRAFADLLTDPETLRALASDDRAILDGQQQRIERELRLVDPGGEPRWFHVIKAPIGNASGQVEQVIGVSIETTERKRAELALFEAKERAQVTLHSIGDAVITTDAGARVDYLNPVAELLTGWSTAEARGKPVKNIFRIVNEQTRETAPDPVQRCLRERRAVSMPQRSVLLGRDGREYDVDDSAAPISGRDGEILGAVLVFHDVTQTRQLTRQLAHDATHDALTGLINRPEFERRLERAVASAHQHGARHVLCYLDLDQFKVVNDTAGHAAGDELLKQINNILAGMFRERDTLARIGGDEFALLQENCPLERAHVIAEAVVKNIREHRFIWEGRSYQVGVSIGLVPISRETRDCGQLLTQADVACYTAKELGRNRVHVYQPGDTETLRRQSEVLGAAGLREAIERDLFRLHYQPIVSLAAQPFQTVRYEALLRVAHHGNAQREGELVLPAAFIPAAERYGLMAAIDRWVIRNALLEYRNGIGQAGGMLAINLSGHSLSDETLLDFIESQFAEHSCPPQRVCFEITETAAIKNLRPALALMSALKRHGCQLALDDFGSGLSSFQYLKTLPVDYLKIDGSFVSEMQENPRSDALVAAINQMSHALGIETVAEYVSSQALVDRLCTLGVDHAQGYFFGKPAPWSKSA
ncbi:MAG TPA: EAL domain-containing protein [Accumulibacter sp.]|uniref:EAL domain-containing protein n=1 Tax=Accumulibacter sp. TaxID=2053492 RepID=UPI002C861477|nr:EAL domain-containing protein [Accumulibacter sp.]HRF74483.1 EAL domain-containing protein [Accumulibacter sp.]